MSSSKHTTRVRPAVIPLGTCRCSTTDSPSSCRCWNQQVPTLCHLHCGPFRHITSPDVHGRRAPCVVLKVLQGSRVPCVSSLQSLLFSSLLSSVVSTLHLSCIFLLRQCAVLTRKCFLLLFSRPPSSCSPFCNSSYHSHMFFLSLFSSLFPGSSSARPMFPPTVPFPLGPEETTYLACRAAVDQSTDTTTPQRVECYPVSFWRCSKAVVSLVSLLSRLFCSLPFFPLLLSCVFLCFSMFLFHWCVFLTRVCLLLLVCSLLIPAPSSCSSVSSKIAHHPTSSAPLRFFACSSHFPSNRTRPTDTRRNHLSCHRHGHAPKGSRNRRDTE